MEFVMTWECPVLSWISVSVAFLIKKDAPLDMRMNQEASLTAYEVVNHYDYHDLVRIFFKYGEDKFSKQIARKIEQAREVKPIETTTELAEIIKSAKPAKELKKRGTLPSRFSRLSESKSMMSWVQQMNPSSRLWTCWL